MANRLVIEYTGFVACIGLIVSSPWFASPRTAADAVTVEHCSVAAVKPADPHAGMRLIPAGSFRMGDASIADANPVHPVTLPSFWMDDHEVTNAEFARFVDATGYVTIAEQHIPLDQYPGVDSSLLKPGSAVFTQPCSMVQLDDPLQWWSFVAGANWRHPQGEFSTITGHADDPVVQVCYDDASAYAAWCGKRLPTEAEWEYAARGGQAKSRYYWGNELTPSGKWAANIFQGHFPDRNDATDGYRGAAPVRSFPPNSYGLYDMAGNVWEWCQDVYHADGYRVEPDNAAGLSDTEVLRVQRGGSFLCSDQYCNRYKSASRGSGEQHSAGNNVGFRCVSPQ